MRLHVRRRTGRDRARGRPHVGASAWLEGARETAHAGVGGEHAGRLRATLWCSLVDVEGGRRIVGVGGLLRLLVCLRRVLERRGVGGEARVCLLAARCVVLLRLDGRRGGGRGCGGFQAHTVGVLHGGGGLASAGGLGGWRSWVVLVEAR